MAKRRARESASIRVAIDALRTRERELRAELSSVNEALRSLEKASGSTKATATEAASPKRKHKMSAAGRAAIGRAARKRWAAWRKSGKKRKGS